MAITLPALPPYKLAAPITLASTALPLSVADAAAVCAKLGADYTFMRIVSPLGFEIVRVACVAGVLTMTRAQGGTVALAQPTGACASVELLAECVLKDWLDLAISQSTTLTAALPAQLLANTVFMSGVTAYLLANTAYLTALGNNPMLAAALIASPAFVTAVNTATNVAREDLLVVVQRLQAGAQATTQHLVNEARLALAKVDFAADDSGAVDSTAQLQAMADANLVLDLGDATKAFKVTGQIYLRDGATVTGNFPLITQTVANTPIFNTVGKKNVTISRLNLRGVGTDYIDSDLSRAIGIFGTVGTTNLLVDECILTNFSYAGVAVHGTTGARVTRSIIVGPGALILTGLTGRCYGVLSDANSVDVDASHNDISYTAQGLRIETTSGYASIANHIHDIVGQHGIYIGAACSYGRTALNDIRRVALDGIKCQTQDVTNVANIGNVFVGNTIDTFGSQGIELANGAAINGVQPVTGSVVMGNTLRNGAGSAIALRRVEASIVTANVVDGMGFNGVTWDQCMDVSITEQRIARTGLSGMRDRGGASSLITLRDNVLRDVAGAGTVGDDFGILSSITTDLDLIENSIRSSTGTMRYGVFFQGTAIMQESARVVRNDIVGAVEAPARFVAGASMREYHKNNFVPGTFGVLNEPTIPTVVAAASITLPGLWDAVYISGTTPITTISVSGQAGATKQLIFTAAGAVGAGGNVGVAATYTAAAGYVLTLTCVGSGWVVSSRGTP